MTKEKGMNESAFLDEIEELKALVVSLVEANNQAQMHQTAQQHVLMSVLQVANHKEELNYYIGKCASAYLAYANDIGQESALTGHYQEAINEYIDFLGETE